jgi:hypothetical protein
LRSACVAYALPRLAHFMRRGVLLAMGVFERINVSRLCPQVDRV